MHTLISFLIGTTYALAGVIVGYLTFCLLVAFIKRTALGDEEILERLLALNLERAGTSLMEIIK